MTAKQLRRREKLDTSYWFVPGLLALAAVGLFALALTADHAKLGYNTLVRAGWLYPGDPVGANEILSRLGGVMMNATSIVFSITLVTLTLAARQYGSIVLRQFLRDRVTQIALGTFNAAFILAMLGMHAVKGGPDSFVPRITITLSIVLAVLSIFMLVYFIHHLAHTLQAEEVVSKVADEMRGVADRLYPPRAVSVADDLQHAAARPAQALNGDGTLLRADRSGYVQGFELDELAQLGQRHDLVVRLLRMPGDYVVEGTPLAVVSLSALTDRLANQFRRAMLIGRHRSARMDVEHAIHEMVEIASRALADNHKDPFTAMLCIDHLAAVLSEIVRRPTPSPYWFDSRGEVRVISQVRPFPTLLSDSFEWIRARGAASPQVLRKLVQMMGALGEHAERPEDLAALRQQLDTIERAAARLEEPRDQAAVKEAIEQTCSALTRPEASRAP